jgi:pimeloyl-ACP methyl ester carboxylesterase
MISGWPDFSKSKTNCRKGEEGLIGKPMLIAGAVIAGVYLMLMAGVSLNQRHMLYFPTTGPLTALEEAARTQHFESWTNPAGQHIGWKRRSGVSTNCAQVMILHGNAAHALAWTDFADALQKVAPLDVFILEYPGYGARPGKPSEKSIFKAAREGLSLLDPNRKIYLVGESLGTGVAAYLAGLSGKETADIHAPTVAGVMLIAAYNNLAAVGQSHMYIFPVRLLLVDRYASDKHLRNYSGPVGFLIGGRDQVIPDRFGRKLYEGYRGPKRLWEDPTAGHDQLHFRELDWWKAVINFWETKQ